MRKRKLQRRSRQLDAMAAAHRLDASHLVEDGRRGRLVVVGCSLARADRQNAGIEGGRKQDRHALLLAQRQQLIERALLDERVAAGQHDAVDVGLARKAQAHRRLVEADADGADHAGATQLDEGRIAPGHCLSEAAIGLGLRAVRPHIDVMDQRDIDPRHAEPQQRLLEGSQRAIAAIVEGRLERQAARAPAFDRLALAERRHPAPDLGGEDEAVARLAAQRVAIEQLAAAVAVVGRGVEVAKACVVAGTHGLGTLLVAQREAKSSNRRTSQAQATGPDGSFAELSLSHRLIGHERAPSRNSSSSRLTASGCSCCTQCPAPFHQVAAQHARAGTGLHFLHRARHLVYAPVALARDEAGRHIDGAAGEDLDLGVEFAARADPIPIQAALEAGPGIFRAVDAKLGLGQPFARRDLGGRRHVRRNRLGHALVQLHDVVGRQLGKLAGGPRLQPKRPVLWPVRALVVVVGAQEGVDALRAVPHVGVGCPRGIVPMVVLARRVERRQVVVDRAAGFGLASLRVVGRVEGHGRRAGERSTHQHHRAEHVRPQQCAPGRNGRAEIVADHGGDGAVAEGRDEPHGIPDQVEKAERPEVAVILAVPADGAAIAALVGGDDMKALRRQRQHHLAPAVGQLREAVQQQEAGPAFGLEARLQDVHPQAVDVVDEASANARRQRRQARDGRAGHRRLRGLQGLRRSNTGAAERANEVFGTRPQLADADMYAPVGRSPPLGVIRGYHGRHAARRDQVASILAPHDGFGRRAILVAAAFKRIPVVSQRRGREREQHEPTP